MSHSPRLVIETLPPSVPSVREAVVWEAGRDAIGRCRGFIVQRDRSTHGDAATTCATGMGVVWVRTGAFRLRVGAIRNVRGGRRRFLLLIASHRAQSLSSRRYSFHYDLSVQ